LFATRIFSQWAVRSGTQWTPQRVAWVSLLMAWGEGQTLDARFEHACEFALEQHPHWKLGRSYSGFTQALVDKSPEMIEHVKRRLRRQMEACFPKQFRDRDGYCVLAADGSRMECPHTIANEAGLGCAGRDKTAPQVFATTLWHAGFALPWDFRTGPGTDSERHHLVQMLEELPENTLLLADGGFVSYDLCRELLARDHSFLMRVGGNITLLEELECDFECDGEIVHLWPKKKRELPPLCLRLIRLQDAEGRTVFLLTNLLERKQLSDENARELYQKRWGIEVFYRSCKQTLERRRCLSRTPDTCRAEAQWMLLGVWLLGLMTVREQIARQLRPHQWSVAKARNVVRRVLRFGGHRSRHRLDFQAGLAAARHDHYTRHGPKAARNYPRKKRQKPPGPPKIKPATKHEQELAKQLRSKPHAVL
jgi:hypothetical protein